jgi:CheY-like chemotaxis protein
VVKLYLPRAEHELATAFADATAAFDLPSGNETILLVEDDALVRDHIAGLLTSLGYRVTPVENAAAALRYLSDEAMPDLLFTDVVMPGRISGFQLAAQLRKRWPELKVLLMSGYPGDGSTADPAIDGAHMLGKPFRRRELACKVRQALEQPLDQVMPLRAGAR